MVERMSFLQSLPASLDDIVRTNRHRLEVGLATVDEVAAVTGCVPPGAAKGTIEDWRIVALRHRAAGLVTLHVLGRFDRSYAWITSYVVALSADRSRVRTRNSLYDLGRPGAGEPDLPLLLHVAHTLKHWGLDEQYDLGVLDVFY